MASPVGIRRTVRAATITVILAAFAVLPGCLQDSAEPVPFTGPSEVVLTPVIPPPPPGPLTALITFSPQNVVAGQTVFFDGSGSSSPSGITSYAWDFGDGTTATGVTVSHPFTPGGTYVVRLTVTATDGSTATVTQVVTVTTAPSADPTASFSFSPSQPAVGDLVAFDASNSSAAPGRTIASTGYSWTFGDNTTGTGVTTTHTYTPSASYAVVLTVTDDAMNTGTTSSTVVVGNPPQPIAAFQTSIGAATTPTFFDGRTSFTQEGQTIVLYAWNFGDSTAILSCDLVTGDGIGPDADDASCGATGDTMTHTYAALGTYAVTLVVTDSAARTDSASEDIIVP